MYYKQIKNLKNNNEKLVLKKQTKEITTYYDCINLNLFKKKNKL